MFPTPLSSKPRWQPVALYFLLACAISGPFFYWRSVLDWEGFEAPGFLRTATYMWGPGIAGIVCHLIYRKQYRKRISVAGTSVLKSVIVWTVPLSVLAALGLRQQGGGLDRTTPLLLIAFGFLTIWGEEVGWRWFLQDYLQGLKPWKRYLIIGVLWELWHFRFLGRALPNYFLVELTLGIPLAVLLTFLIGRATQRTKTLAVAATLHAWIDLPLEYPQLHTYIAAGVAVALCLWYFLTSPKDGTPLPASTGNGVQREAIGS